MTGRRDDGYHLLDSLVGFADMGDVVTVEPSSDASISLSIEGRFALLLRGDSNTPASQNNLIIRAAQTLKLALQSAGHSTNDGARIALDKSLPIGAGIGGGSADAAATLHALNALWNCGLSAQELADMGAPLGADIPVCVHGTAARMRGIGEEIQSVRLGISLPVLLVTPNQHVSTVEVFRSYASNGASFSSELPELPKNFLTITAFTDWLNGATRNDLYDAALEHCPMIGEVIAVLERETSALTARMSGSGATCFAIYADVGALQQAVDKLTSRYPSFWVQPCQIEL